MTTIITDSTCDLTLGQLEALGVTMLSLSVNFGETSYRDKRDITNEEFYVKLAQAPELPTTSLVNPEAFAEAYNAHPDNEIVVLTISGKISGTFQSATIAKQASGREDIYLVDTNTSSAALGMLVVRAAELAKAGMGGAAIADAIQALAAKSRLIGVVDTLKYLVKGGRLNKVSGYMGGMLNIKPVLTLDDGAVKPLLKARGDRDAFAKVKELVEKTYPLDPAQPIAFAYAGGGEQRLEAFMAALGLTGTVSSIGSVVGTHAGPRTIIICYFEK